MPRNPALAMAMRLAKAGYWQGDPGAILRAPADLVFQAIQYENFSAEYEHAVVELNREP